jgi:hypothetical protein
MMTENGMPKRHNTYIDIPDSLRLPHFMLADQLRVEEDAMGFSTEYKLVLQSVVCHRGDSLQSGHYIAFARVAPKLLTDNRRHDFDPPPDYEEAQWAKFDDLQLDNRVAYVDDIKESLKTEMPYLLFYQIVPMVDVVCPPSTEDTETEPPSYNASKLDITTGPPTPNLAGPNQLGIMNSTDYFDSANMSKPMPRPPSIRLSADMDRSGRTSSGDEDPHAAGRLGDSRRTSITFTDSTFGTPAITPEAASPAITPNEETTAQRLSRAASRFAKGGSRSRPVSQAGDGRISTTMNRLSGLMRTSKEPLRDGQSGLPISTSISAPPTTYIPSREGDAVEAEAASPLESKSTGKEKEKEKEKERKEEKHSHRRGKSKSRSEREKDKTKKAGDPPERECSIM